MNHRMILLFGFGLLMACSVPPQQGAVVQAKLTVNDGFSTQAAPATTADVDHYTYKLRDNGTNAVIGTFTSGSTSFTFTGVVGGVYKLTAEAFSSSNDTTSVTQGGEATSSNTVTVSGAGVSYSSGGALAATLNLLSGDGETIKGAAAYTGNIGDVDHFTYEVVRTSDSQVVHTANSAASAMLFSQFSSGTYKLRVRAYGPGSTPITCAYDSTNTVTIGSSGVSYSSGTQLATTVNASDFWTTSGYANIPTTAREYQAVASLGGKLYSVGTNNESCWGRTEVYDPILNSWTVKADHPGYRSRMRAVAYDGKVYGIGGRDCFGSYYSNLDAYDPGTNSWTAKTSMSGNRADFAAEETGGKIYVFGGSNGSTLSSVEEYNPGTDGWTAKLAMPQASYGHAAATVNGKIYLFGGDLTATYEYDPVGNTYASKAAMPTARRYLGAVAVDGKICAMGGNDGSSTLNTVEVYNPSSNTWATKSSMPNYRERFGIGVSNSSIFVIGGSWEGAYQSTVNRYDP